MENISKKVNLRTKVDVAIVVNTFNCVNSATWHYIVDVLSNNKIYGFSSNIRKEIKNKLEKQYGKD